ncbi:MAG: tetratricopeptide repeat protein, partial [Candidatus Omnitrophica bacterium]|nr:tetratricopeptide repeat protein [Candidatus Omnitrophota bacterium]
EKDILFKTIGRAKIVLSNVSYLRADVYFHGGLPRRDEWECGEKHSDNKHECQHEDGHKHESEEEHEHDSGHVCGPDCKHEHDPTGTAYPRAPQRTRQNDCKKDVFKPLFNPLAQLAKKIELHEHRHLSGMEERETLPWFYYAAKLNPHHIKAYVLGGYCAGSCLGRPDEGIIFLREGLRYNPDSWEIHAEIGNLYYKEKKDSEKAIIYYEKARGCFTDTIPDKYERRNMLVFLRESYKKQGEVLKAQDVHKEILKYFPEN